MRLNEIDDVAVRRYDSFPAAFVAHAALRKALPAGRLYERPQASSLLRSGRLRLDHVFGGLTAKRGHMWRAFVSYGSVWASQTILADSSTVNAGASLLLIG